MEEIINVGLDAGSTTIKVVATGGDHQIIFKDYRRHYANICSASSDVLQKLRATIGDARIRIAITGSAGMGIAERCSIPFIQEVVASCGVVTRNYPSVKTFIDVGGEDAKMIFFGNGPSPDIRMNGSCAGGTGAFLDQMASILGIDTADLGRLAESSTTTYPIASRCGVFSKTDIQNLLSRNVGKEDIAASVFRAVCMQVVTSLARGYDIKPCVLICGGPFAFIPALRKALLDVTRLSCRDVVMPEHAEVIPAWGAAINADNHKDQRTVSDVIRLFSKLQSMPVEGKSHRLRPLFEDETEARRWQDEKTVTRLPAIGIRDVETEKCYLGIDSGSTTTKIVALDDKGRMFFSSYAKNQGDSLTAVRRGLEEFHRKAAQVNRNFIIAGSCATGYGEDLIRNAFSIDYGIVETMAHYTAAVSFDPDVSFILDIGGQDMKAAFIENGSITRLEINEACSSGCGSFIETFAQSLDCTVADFARRACTSLLPCDLGTRCTVFMNSKVKQSLREGAEISDISAGLSYSVVKNCLNKVLKIKDIAVLGNRIMVQGGAFRNQSIVRALEIETGKRVMVTDYPELMGAFGAALHAKHRDLSEPGKNVPLEKLMETEECSSAIILCKGCENACTVTRFTFGKNRKFFAGNKCEKMFSSRGGPLEKGVNMHAEKYGLLFDRQSRTDGNPVAIGIPRILGIYENYPFWHALLTGCGFSVILSDASTMPLYETGINTVMSDNICFPAKLAHGHIIDLIGKKVDRIFVPFVVYENKENDKWTNSYNCPIVTGYSEVLKSSVNPANRYGIPIDAPTFTFKDKSLMEAACRKYLSSLPGAVVLTKPEFRKIFTHAVEEQRRYENTLISRCEEVVATAATTGKLVVLLAGRPYHVDPLIQHKIAEVIADFGVDVITEDIVRGSRIPVDDIQSILQWSYSNRIMTAAEWAASSTGNIHFVELTSFGCGPDAFILDEVSDILRRHGKNATLLKIDDVNNIGSMRLRIRSLIESLKLRNPERSDGNPNQVHTPVFMRKDRVRKILIPWFGDFYSPFFPGLFRLMGYDAETLPPSDQASVEYGLKYLNNEVCYPATLVVGDFMKALLSGKYEPDKIALAITQTGGQCRATSYLTSIKKALVSAGFNDTPVISVAYDGGEYNEQSGFRFAWERHLNTILHCLVFADCLSQLYYTSRPREREAGSVERIKNTYIRLGVEALLNNAPKQFLSLAAEAAGDFNRAIERRDVPRIGFVGEIFVKYNPFANKSVIDWLAHQGIEPVVPPLTEFFLEGMASGEARIDGNIEKRNWPKFFKDVVERLVFRIIRKMESQVAVFPYYRPIGNPHSEAREASKILNLNAQFGEGWLIPAAFSRFAHEGINNIVSLQPFGCIANHIISKGIEKRTKDLYPKLNMLFLDFDSGMSDANILNRLHFMIQNAKNEVFSDPGGSVKESAFVYPPVGGKEAASPGRQTPPNRSAEYIHRLEYRE